MATAYGSYDSSAGYDAYRAVLDYSYTSSNTQVTISTTGKVQSGYGHDSLDNFDLSLTIGDSTEWKSSSEYMSAGSTVTFGSKSRTYNRTHSAQSIAVKAYAKNDGTYTGWTGSSTASATVSVPALPSYAVTYNANNGTGAPSGQTKWYNESLTLSSTKPTRSGYIFKGWATSASATTATYQPGASYATNAALSLYAVWQQGTYTVSYSANGGSSTPASQTKTHDVALTLRPAITRSNATATYTVTLNANGGSSTGDSDNKLTTTSTTTYTFAGWKATNGTVYAASGSYTTNAATIMTAQWNSSTSTPNVTLPTPTWASHDFNGWYTAQTNGTRVGGAGSSYKPTASITLYAQWTAYYTVTYNANGGSGAPSSQKKVHGSAITLSKTTPTLSGYTFIGWATSSSRASAGTVDYIAGAAYSADANATLYAVWRMTITYDANGGGGVPTAQYGYKGSNVTLSSTIPAQTGYRFIGWNTNTVGTGTHYSPGASYAASSGNITLHAMWRRIVVSVVAGTARRNGTTCTFSARWVCQGTVAGTVSSSALYSDTDSMPTRTLTLTGDTTGTKVAGTDLSGTVSGSFECPEGTVGRALVTLTFTDTYTTAYSATHVETAQVSVTVAKAFRLLTGKHGASWTDEEGDTYSEGLAIGLLASLIGRLEVGLTTLFRKAVTMDKSLSVGSSITAGGQITTDTSAHVIKDTRFDRDGANPSSDMGSAVFGIQDKDGEPLGYLQVFQSSAGTTGFRMAAYAEGTDSTQYYNLLQVGVNKSGTKSYAVTDAAAFRTAINAQVSGDYAASSTSQHPYFWNAGGADQLWGLSATCQRSTNTSYYGKQVGLLMTNTTCGCYNNTDSATLWTAYTTQNKPTPAAIGAQPAGSYVTTNCGGYVNALASTSTQQWYIHGKVNNSSNTARHEHDTWLVMNNGGPSCWDATASATIWQALTNNQGLSSATGTANTYLNALTWRWFTIGGMRIAFAHGTTKTLAVTTVFGGDIYYQSGGITVPIPSSVGFTAAPYGVITQFGYGIMSGPSTKGSWSKTQVIVDAMCGLTRTGSGYEINLVVWGV